MKDLDGRSPADAGSGLRPYGAEPAAQSQAEPLVPNAKAMSTTLQCTAFGNDLIDLLRREGKHSGVWFADRLLQAAHIIENLWMEQHMAKSRIRQGARRAIVARGVRVGSVESFMLDGVEVVKDGKITKAGFKAGVRYD